jgi:hypothetical protein
LIVVVIVTLLAAIVSLWQTCALSLRNVEAKAQFDAIQIGTPIGGELLTDVIILNTQLAENNATGFRSLRYSYAIRSASELFPPSWITLTIGEDNTVREKVLRGPTVTETLRYWFELAKMKLGR